MPTPNRLARTLARFDTLPSGLRRITRNFILRRAVPFTGTARLDYLRLDAQQAEVAIANRRAVRNHIGGVHAAAMTLLAETATGMVVGMNVRDDCLPLAKSLKVDFRKRASGALRAVARLSPEQQALMRAQDKGEVSVKVEVSDESGANPIECEFIWAWVPKPR